MNDELGSGIVAVIDAVLEIEKKQGTYINIPDSAFTVAQYVKKSGRVYSTASRHLNQMERDGILMSGKRSSFKYYWLPIER